MRDVKVVRSNHSKRLHQVTSYRLFPNYVTKLTTSTNVICFLENLKIIHYCLFPQLHITPLEFYTQKVSVLWLTYLRITWRTLYLWITKVIIQQASIAITSVMIAISISIRQGNTREHQVIAKLHYTWGLTLSTMHDFRWVVRTLQDIQVHTWV